MGEARRRKQLGIATVSRPTGLMGQIDQTPEHWSLACSIGVGRLLTITVCQDDPDVLKQQFLQVSGQPASVLTRVNKQGILATAIQGQAAQFVLLRPDAVRSYLEGAVKGSIKKQVKPVLVVQPYADAESLKHLVNLWYEVKEAQANLFRQILQEELDKFEEEVGGDLRGLPQFSLLIN